MGGCSLLDGVSPKHFWWHANVLENRHVFWGVDDLLKDVVESIILVGAAEKLASASQDVGVVDQMLAQ